jgi:hypothetical protein
LCDACPGAQAWADATTRRGVAQALTAVRVREAAATGSLPSIPAMHPERLQRRDTSHAAEAGQLRQPARSRHHTGRQQNLLQSGRSPAE